MNERDLSLLKRLASGIAAQFGENCEVVVHEVNREDMEHSIVAIENGHVSGRSVGDGPTKPVLRAMNSKSGILKDQLNYLIHTDDGRVLKSSTVYVNDDDGQVIGVFSINFDVTDLLMAEQSLRKLTSVGAEGDGSERLVKNVRDLLDELIEQSVALVGKPVARMTKDDKIRAIQFLDQAGAFLITKSGDKVSRYFGISKFTLYSYIDAKL